MREWKSPNAIWSQHNRDHTDPPHNYQHDTDPSRHCYGMWLRRDYWCDYNIVEALAWLTKAIIIIPGLVFKVEIWWLYVFSLATSTMLVWASEKKLLPTLVGFNTMWIWLSLMVLAQNLMP